MGMPYLFYFDESDPEAHYYRCRACKTHIALVSDIICTYRPGLNGQMGGIFKKIVNVHIDESAPPMNLASSEEVVPHKALEIQCNQCMNLLGWKYNATLTQVELSEEGEAFIYDGDIELQMLKLEEIGNRTVAAGQLQQAPGNMEDIEMAEQEEQQEDAEMRDSEDLESDEDA